MPTRPPKILYRYRPCDARTIHSLVIDELYFAQPSTFNDPLDCSPSVMVDSNVETLRTVLSAFVSQRVSTATKAALERAKLKGPKSDAHAEAIGNREARIALAEIDYNATNPDYEDGRASAELWLLGQEIEGELLGRNDKGVCSFSAIRNSPLLWSHYADQHRGICIGYSLDRNPKPDPQRVVYGGSRTIGTSVIEQAIIKKDPEAQRLLDEASFLRKAHYWKYEKEWRLLDRQGPQHSPLKLKEVTFGLRCEPALRFAVMRALKSRSDVKFFQINVQDGSFRLKRYPLDFDEEENSLPVTAMSGEEMGFENEEAVEISPPPSQQTTRD